MSAVGAAMAVARTAARCSAVGPLGLAALGLLAPCMAMLASRCFSSMDGPDEDDLDMVLALLPCCAILMSCSRCSLLGPEPVGLAEGLLAP